MRAGGATLLVKKGVGGGSPLRKCHPLGQSAVEAGAEGDRLRRAAPAGEVRWRGAVQVLERCQPIRKSCRMSELCRGLGGSRVSEVAGTPRAAAVGLRLSPRKTLR